MINKIEIGEIVRIDGREYVIAKRGNFNMPMLVLLFKKNDGFIQNNQRKNKTMKRGFKSIKWTKKQK